MVSGWCFSPSPDGQYWGKTLNQFLWEYPVVLVRAMLNLEWVRFKTAKNCSHEYCSHYSWRNFELCPEYSMHKTIIFNTQNCRFLKRLQHRRHPLSIPLFCIGFAARFGVALDETAYQGLPGPTILHLRWGAVMSLASSPLRRQ